ncbi:hypothetical protein IWQ47_003219 [Aquimarina sp. EL_43]|uniref:DUF434 domain-containing protein n=1 Tax=Aquimarina TaxID=290174 RepID=UPI000472E4CA|nr:MULTISPECIES: DUF434 domain-containing protein [Aquimarina]MBG6132039.1 hypothetical protein [Aquimarina sp. EL_35]MBG6149603.1 hypothetical protein [Aquimarina sp. EL_32]MBG6170134.1 hypothetical protein [Aquimarina sp. EL_43]
MTTRNRGREASDDRLFGELPMQEKLKAAAKDMLYLLSHGYAEKSSVQLVGNRYTLNARQQRALHGMSCSEQQIAIRNKNRVTSKMLKGQTIAIDGFNLLIILESALSGAYIFKGLDGYYRDVSGVHGTYKRVQKTEEALLVIGNTLDKLGVSRVHWYFDAPVSNSGRLKTTLRELAEQHHFSWTIDLVNNPDKELASSAHIVVSSDAWILDRAQKNTNLAAYLIEHYIQEANIVCAE